MFRNIFLIFVYIIASSLLISCNNDIEIVNSKNNTECYNQATCFAELTDLKYEIPGEPIPANPALYSEEELYVNRKISKPENIKILKNTNTLLLRNNSKTKVYKVRIQKINRLGRVGYKDFRVEPTQEICIGCDSDFDLKLSQVKTEYGEYGTLSYKEEYLFEFEGDIKKVYKSKFKIHDIELISEY